MSYLSYDDFTKTEFKGMANVKEFYDFEVSICRLDGEMYIVKEKDGYAILADTVDGRNGSGNYGDKEGKGVSTRIKYYNNGDIDINFGDPGTGSYYWHRQIDGLLRYLPENVHFYMHRDKMFLIYDKDEVDVRRRNYDVTTVFEKVRDLVTLKANGNVNGCKEINRGETKFADDKPMKDQLEPKHFKEMTKARLDSDFVIDLNKLYATFRGISTGKYHMALEMHRPSKWEEYGNGPNSGLIRKLHVARFVSDPIDISKARALALSICSDLPDSCLGSNLRNLREQDNAKANV